MGVLDFDRKMTHQTGKSRMFSYLVNPARQGNICQHCYTSEKRDCFGFQRSFIRYGRSLKTSDHIPRFLPEKAQGVL